MSSWGWGWKCFDLQAVNDFSIFYSKSVIFFLFIFMWGFQIWGQVFIAGRCSILGLKVHFLGWVGGIKLEFWWAGGGCQEPTFESTKQPQCPSGGPVITLTKTRPKAEFDGMGWMGWDGVGRWSKGSFNFFHFKIY